MSVSIRLSVGVKIRVSVSGIKRRSGVNVIIL